MLGEEVKNASPKKAATDIMNLDDQTSQFASSLVTRFFSLQAVINGVTTAIRTIMTAIKELDAAFNAIAVVTQYSTKEVWGMYDAFNAIAVKVGITSSEIANIAGEYFRQGKSYADVLTLTEVAAKAAKIAGIEAGDSVKYLTSALNGYNLAASQALEVSDKLALVAAASATDYEELAIAMSKVAAQASNAGVSMDNLIGFMATALEVTQEGS